MQHWGDSDPPPFEILIQHTTADAVVAPAAKLYCCICAEYKIVFVFVFVSYFHLFKLRDSNPPPP